MIGFPKCERPAKTRARHRRKAMAVAAVDRDSVVFPRQQYRCYGFGVNPKCQGRAQDPHELIPVSLGGQRVSWNRVGLCRRCHQATDATVGGRRLWFDWPGKADGAMPNADQPGHVRAVWRVAA